MKPLDTVSSWLRCPTCSESLRLVETSLLCTSRHTFDVAKQGYVNLFGLPAPANADTSDMLAARDRFLSAGHYDPITQAAGDAIPNSRRLLEVGAGTGHHLAKVLNNSPGAAGLAADISVPASRRAAKAHPHMAAVVCDTWQSLPLHDNTVDAVLCIFAPRNPAEFARVLTDDGVVVVVLPHDDHLQELRTAHGLLAVGQDKMNRLLSSAEGHLDCVERTHIAYDLDLSPEAATDLVAMGPNAFHTAPGIPATRVRVSVSCVTLVPTGTPRQ